MEQHWEQWDEENNHSGSGLVARLYKLKTWHQASFASIADLLGVLEHSKFVLNVAFFVCHEYFLHPKSGNLQEVSRESVHIYLSLIHI